MPPTTPIARTDLKGEGQNNYAHLEAPRRVCHAQPWSTPLSVVIPYRDDHTLLGCLLRSLRTQAYPSHLIEIIIVDDDSRRSPVAVSPELFSDPRIRLIRLPDRTGLRLATVRNRGIEAAQGEIIVCLDQDIICPPHLLQAHLSWFDLGSDVATFGLRRFIDASAIDPPQRSWERCAALPDIRSSSNNHRGVDKRRREVQLIKDHPAPYNCFHGCNVAFTKDLATRCGMFDTNYDGCFGYEDIDFGRRLWQCGAYIVHAIEAEVLHQENDVVPLSHKVASSANRERLLERSSGLREIRRRLADEHWVGPTWEPSDT